MMKKNLKDLRILILLLILFQISTCFGQKGESSPINISEAVAYTKTLPLTDLIDAKSFDKEPSILNVEIKNELNIVKWEDTDRNRETEAIQSKMGFRGSKGQQIGFEGQGPTGYYPPDTDGDVNDTYFVQMVNSKYNVYLKNGTKVLGPLDLSTLWNQLPGGPWGNSGDPIILYDEEADRWVLTQFAPRNNYTENYELFAISETSDPTGSYHLYAFSFGNQFNDYPKIGVWNDGYYATYNMFSRSGGNFYHIGAKFTSVERDKMLIGDPNAQMVEFFKSGYYSAIPADIDGNDLPDDGEACPIMYLTAAKKIELWGLNVNWNNTGSSSLSLMTTLSPSYFTEYYSDIPQPNGQGLDALGGMIMNRLAYRKFDTYASMVTNHTVVANSKAGVRWYEMRKLDGANWTLYQEGTYAPNDDAYRWMGSAAINANGDIALGYSVANGSSIHPSIRATGRHASDPLGEMTIEEIELKTGTSSQSSFDRWGDYSCMNVDPSDGETFWYTTEYNGWRTWISSFDLGSTNEPTVNAGSDESICQDMQFNTNASGSGILEMQWTTDGDGFFSSNDQFISTYIRGSQDVINGGCTLTLNATGYDGSEVSDNMFLTIIKNPESNAGPNEQITSGNSYQMQGSINYSNNSKWTSTGDGNFDDDTDLNASYTPGPADIADGSVILSLEAFPMSPCSDSDMDEMTLNIMSDATLVAFNPLHQDVSTAEIFATSIQITEVENLGSFEMSLSFNPDYLQVNSVNLGDFLGSTGRQVFPLTNSFDNMVGSIDFAVTTLGVTPAGPNGNGELINIEWTSTEDLEEDVITNLIINELQITQPNGNVIQVSAQNGTIGISACYENDFDCDCDVDIVDITIRILLMVQKQVMRITILLSI